MILTAVSVKNTIHMNFIENTLPEISNKNRNFIFTYIDVEIDSYLTSYFKINTSQLPRIVVYDFKEKLFYVDNPINLEEINSSEESFIENIYTIIKKVKNNNLIWSTGNWFEDILLKFGIKFTQTTIMYILGVLFALIVLIMIIVIFYCGEKNEVSEIKNLNEASKINKEVEQNNTPIENKEMENKKNQ
jgi:hypothetical protein